MPIHPLCLLLLVAVPALRTLETAPNCIIGCKCEEEVARRLKIRECDSPLVLTQEALVSVSKKITCINFKNVVIKRIDKDAFTGFDELENVVVEDSSIESIHSSAFDLPELGTINFIKTAFGESPNLSSEYLEELIFNDCNLSQVPNLDNLPALSFLNLANNFIENIDESAFRKVESLEEITLTNNSLTKLPPNLFVNNPDFNILTLDHNPLTTFNLNIPSALELLSLRQCNLSSFDRGSIESLDSLSSLDLSGNQISALPIDAFDVMKDLNYLDLSNNNLVELDDDIFLENTKLDRIILDNNQFEALPKFQTSGKPFQTYTFSCKNCGLKSVKGSFENMPGLVTLELSNNKIQDIEGVFGEMNGLKQIFLSNNEIATIGINSFGKNSELETLDLSNNPLSPLDPVVFASLPGLRKLNVSSCTLKNLWTNHNAEVPSLEQLFVGKNQLTAISIEDLKIIPKLKLIDIQENPLSCNEDLYEFVSYLVEKSVYPKEAAVKTHEELTAGTGTDLTYDPKSKWQSVLPPDCNLDSFEDEDTDNFEDDDDNDVDVDDDTNDENTEYVMDDQEDIGVEASVLTTSGFNLAKASYILSITSVFILTALLVLFVAVVITLLILKKNKSFNMHNGNLPRLKIPLWHTTPGQKKHSGSIYRPLSEELSGSRTPIINRYDFKQTPQVHNSLP